MQGLCLTDSPDRSDFTYSADQPPQDKSQLCKTFDLIHSRNNCACGTASQRQRLLERERPLPASAPPRPALERVRLCCAMCSSPTPSPAAPPRTRSVLRSLDGLEVHARLRYLSQGASVVQRRRRSGQRPQNRWPVHRVLPLFDVHHFRVILSRSRTSSHTRPPRRSSLQVYELGQPRHLDDPALRARHTFSTHVTGQR